MEEWRVIRSEAGRKWARYPGNVTTRASVKRRRAHASCVCLLTLGRMFRRCFLQPIPEHDLAATLLAEGADALLKDHLNKAADLIRKSDLLPLEDYRYRVAGRLDAVIHRIAKMPVYERISRPAGRRMPAAALTRQVFARDGYRCRFCDSKVIVKEARKAFINALPTIVRWGSTNRERHFGLAVLSASIDHVVPFQRGGCSEDPANLVTTCNPCQFGRGHCLLDEVQLEDPRRYPPTVDGWDGLTRLRGFKLRRNCSSAAEVPRPVTGPRQPSSPVVD